MRIKIQSNGRLEGGICELFAYLSNLAVYPNSSDITELGEIAHKNLKRRLKMERVNLIPPSIANNLPAMVRNELVKLSAEKQEEFVEEYRRKAKSVGIAYILWLLFVHYAYLRKWGILVLFWLTGGGAFFWWLIDAFRIPGMIRNYNKDVAVDVLRNLKAISD